MQLTHGQPQVIGAEQAAILAPRLRNSHTFPWQEASKLRRCRGLRPQDLYLVKLHLQSISHAMSSLILKRTFPSQSKDARKTSRLELSAPKPKWSE